MEKTTSNIYVKLLNIQQNLKCSKNQFNKFGNYNYRSCEDILESVKPLLKDNNLTLMLNDNMIQVGERYYIKATAILIDVETSEQLQVNSYAREEESKKGMDGSQVTGASSSYARKYALNGLFGIDDTKDSDATNTGEDKQKNKITTKEQALAYKTNFGKYKGKTLKEIIDTDKDYANWLFQNGDETVKKCLNLILNNKGKNVQQKVKKEEKVYNSEDTHRYDGDINI